jgi:hypothetical protein
MKLIKKLKIGRGVESESSSSEEQEDEDLEQISLNTVKDLYENSGDGIEESGSFNRSKRRKKATQDNEEMNLSEIEKNLEDGVD